MKVPFFQSFDFNQMLVFSVFWHLLILTVVLFLPKPTLPENTVVPAFMVSLVSEPAGFKPAAQKRPESLEKARKTKARKKDVEKKVAPKKLAKLKKTTASKPVEVKKVPTVKTPKSDRVLEALNKLEGKKALMTPNIVEELAQVARLEKPKIKPPPAKPIKQKSITEKTVRDLEALKNKKITDKKTIVPALPHKDILEDFEAHKMERNLLEMPTPLEKQQRVPGSREPNKPKTSKRDLLKELEQMAKLDSPSILAPDVETETPETAGSTQKNSESYDTILEKLEPSSVNSEPVKVEIPSVRIDLSSFQSNLRTQASETTPEMGTGNSYVSGKPDARSLYVGIIREKIYKNWQEPLAEEHNQETVVSFYIFPGGNIDKPSIKKSSKVEALDTLAVKAVLDSAPFPEFPKELKMPNLNISIYFKYVSKDE